MLKSSIRLFEVIPGSKMVVVIYDQFTTRSCIFEKKGQGWNKVEPLTAEEEKKLKAYTQKAEQEAGPDTKKFAPRLRKKQADREYR